MLGNTLCSEGAIDYPEFMVPANLQITGYGMMLFNTGESASFTTSTVPVVSISGYVLVTTFYTGDVTRLDLYVSETPNPRVQISTNTIHFNSGDDPMFIGADACGILLDPYSYRYAI